MGKTKSVAGDIRRLRKLLRPCDNGKDVTVDYGELHKALESIEAKAASLREENEKLKNPMRRFLSFFEKETLVAAWRYYDKRKTIAAVDFPNDIVRRFWSERGMNEWRDEARTEIASQFADIDHRRGEEDWSDCGDESDSWRKFYGFCYGVVHGFRTIVTSLYGKRQEIESFRAMARWYPVEQYVVRPYIECYVDDDNVISVK